MNACEISPEIIAEHGLTPEEFEKILAIVGRAPNLTELGIFSAMWNEHCSYKSSKVWLRHLPSEAPWVLHGPGENAGVVDIGGGLAVVFKMESHNHPSFIEPYQGAATGVGGIMRDIFTMGARPVANLNVLRFGDPDHPRTRYLVSGVVAGIGGYGNCMGVPTVGGETTFHASCNGNNLVNAMCVGVAPSDRIFLASADEVGAPVVYVGSRTGRDGIHGASMASAGFDGGTDEKRPTVQVGDPFTEKLLLEACLELMETDSIIGIQDMGAAGLTCSSVEMAGKAHRGIELDLERVPQREADMSAYELMLSESQERMLFVLKPGTEDRAREIFGKWGVEFAIIGRINDSGRLVVRMNGVVEADVPIQQLSEQSPVYDRPWNRPSARPTIDPGSIVSPGTIESSLMTLLASPDLASRRWIWDQYDHLVMGQTIVTPGSDAAVIALADDPQRGLALTSDCTPRYCAANPREGAKQAVAESWRNLVASGARPLAITDCLNFGSPEDPDVMGEFAACVQGLADAATVLEMPVVSGNVSFYNETNGSAVQPSPSVGAVGVIEDLDDIVPMGIADAGLTVVLIGDTVGHVGASLYLREIIGREDGTPPPVDLFNERRTGLVVRDLILNGQIRSCHDVSDGGLLVAIAEMAMNTGIGCSVSQPVNGLPPAAFWFGEDQGRFVVCVEPDSLPLSLPVNTTTLGTTGGKTLTVDGGSPISVQELREANERWFPAFMSNPSVQ